MSQLRYSGPEKKGNFSCAATLVAPRVMLTLASCAFDDVLEYPASALFPDVSFGLS
jgi:V8-like Glu-specific endopeptidase